jgi:hypothetical protein
MYLPRRRVFHRCRVIYARSCSLYLADVAPHAQQGTGANATIVNPAHRGNLRRRPCDDFRERTPTTSASIPHTHLHIGAGTTCVPQQRRRRDARSYHPALVPRIA